MKRYDKLHIADEMLDSAIEEFLDNRRFFAALNMAGVAQELYGKAIRIENGQDTITKIANESFEIYKKNRSSDSTLKEFKEISSHAKNGIKHFDTANDQHIEIDPNKEARLMIAVALNDKAQLERPESNWDKRFKEFATIYNWYHIENMN
jgi:hypothetical protein